MAYLSGIYAGLSEDVKAAVIGAIVGALVEVLLGWFLLTWYFSRRNDLGVIVGQIGELLDGLSKDSAEYWLQDTAVLTPKDRILLEARIKAGVLQVLSWTIVIRGNYSKVPDTVRHKIARLQDACTGGDFETNGRLAERGRYVRIVNLAHEIQRDLYELKLPIVWLRRFRR